MNTFSNLIIWGWNSFFENQIDTDQLSQNSVIARIIGQERGLYRLHNDSWAQLSGKFAHQNQNVSLTFPGVGDWVICRQESSADRALIESVLERKSCFYRKGPGSLPSDQIIASNIDTVFIVTSPQADLNFNRLDRYLSLIWDSDAKPVILLSKADLHEDIVAIQAEVEERFIGVDVHNISSVNGTNLQSLTPYLQSGKTVALVGSSGVGKSTLANALRGNQEIKTQETRSFDDKGKHTTTSRHIYLLPQGALLMDTPGMRILEISDQSAGVAQQFEDIVDLVLQCRFTDCRHNSEPDCAIRDALEQGSLEPARWESYLKLRKESRYQEIKADHAKRKQEEAKWKKIHKDLRVRYKMKAKGEI